jgi:hypothetical protein
MSASALGYQQITSLAAATALTIPAGTGFAIITPAGQSVRWRDDGVDPTAGVGYPLAAGSELQYAASSLSRLKFIEQVASATLNIAYFSGN